MACLRIWKQGMLPQSLKCTGTNGSRPYSPLDGPMCGCIAQYKPPCIRDLGIRPPHAAAGSIVILVT